MVANKQLRIILLLSIVIAILSPALSLANGKIVLYGIRMVPDGDDAEDYSRPGWGGGLRLVSPLPDVPDLIAGCFGFEYVNLLSQTIKFENPQTHLRVENQTNQGYFRLFLGGEIGAHGKGFLRPFAGVNLALVVYHVNTDVVIPNDSDPDNETSQDLDSQTEATFGYDLNLGADLNFSNSFVVEGGVRYLHSFNVPVQLDVDNAIKVEPRYFQVYIGIGISLNLIDRAISKD